MRGHQALTSSARDGRGSDLWRTPLWLVRAFEQTTGYSIEGDMACSGKDSVMLRLGRTFFRDMDFTLGRNGLTDDWPRPHHPVKDCIVWCNPPYSQVAEWAAKACREAEGGCRSVLLVPARVDTGWWHDLVGHQHCTQVLYLRGRVAFEPPPGVQSHGGSTFPSALVILGRRPCYPGPYHKLVDWRAFRAANDNDGGAA